MPMRRGLLSVLLTALIAASGCKDEGTIRVRSLTFNGVKAVSESKLRSVLATRTSSRLPWGRKANFERSRLDADLKRITAFYADRGFPDARVTGFDVKLNEKQDSVDITVNVSEGDPIRVAAIDFTGFDVIPPAHFDQLKKVIPLRVGEPRDRQVVATTHEMAVNEFKDHGYPYARVTTTEDDGPNGKSATITFAADSGQIAYFGPVAIVGNKSVSDNIIRRELAYKPGALYQRSLIQETQRRLFGLELFQFVNIGVDTPDQKSTPAGPADAAPSETPAPPADTPQPPEVPTRITVAEGNHQRVNFGLGYGSEEKARVDAEYHHVNFLGGARSAGIHARWSSLDRGLRLDFTQPYFFAPHLSLGGAAQDWYTFTPAYTSVVIGAKATFTHRSGPATSWAVSFSSERDVSTIAPDVLNDPKLYADLIAIGLDPTTGEQRGTLSAVGFDFQHATADNLLNPTRGHQIAFHVEDGGRLLPGTFKYLAVTIDGRLYIPLSERIVLATRAQAGNIAPENGDQALVPFSRKYFLGGATSIRGWGRYEVSPLGESGLPLGGDSLLAFSEELRVLLRGNLGGVVFLDAGNVWATSWDMRLNDLRYAIGAGVRYLTPIGPFRLDYGYQLNPIPGLIVNGEPQTRRWRIHFSIGQAF